ncbi:hypothetical protein RRG08_066746 [Elysia crispata]|uniref:Uncharacterized protein n=1 Tax=Elysia crispata TaxID=231223 RepID=A0AAE0Z9V7_9GAST|nr:hypothetical protein RRG08_066746 [Elysia crispata]
MAVSKYDQNKTSSLTMKNMVADVSHPCHLNHTNKNNETLVSSSHTRNTLAGDHRHGTTRLWYPALTPGTRWPVITATEQRDFASDTENTLAGDHRHGLRDFGIQLGHRVLSGWPVITATGLRDFGIQL